MNKHLVFKIVSILCITVLVTSCKDHKEEYHSITDKIDAESKNYHGTSISSEKYLDGLDMIEVTENGQAFLIPDRKGQLKSYACSECHTKPLANMQSKDLKKAHWNIKLQHANLNTMNCATCHNANDMDNLKSVTGVAIDFNKSYQLCSQCHTKQFTDWSGGAHGKRIGGWAPPRASMTCVNCHDPHKPQIAPKWPERYNTLKVEERK